MAMSNIGNLLMILLMGVMITTLTLIVVFFICRKILNLPLTASLGAICGGMTSTPSLGVLVKEVEEDSPMIAYAAVYPVAMIVLTLIGRIIVMIGQSVL